VDLRATGRGWRRRGLSNAAGHGSSGGGVFARGSGHNEKGQYSERPDDFERNMERINKKFETARSFVPRPELAGSGKAKSASLRMARRTGPSSNRAISCRRSTNWKRTIFACLHIRYARGPRLHSAARRTYVVEQNRDGQMASLLKLDIKAELTPRLRSICHVHGLPIDARSVTDELMMMEGSKMGPQRIRGAASSSAETNRMGCKSWTIAAVRQRSAPVAAQCDSERIIDAMYEMGVPPERVAKFSGIGARRRARHIL